MPKPKPKPKPVRHRPLIGGRLPNKDAAEDKVKKGQIETSNPAADKLMKELNKLVGLSQVKAGMAEMRAMVEFDQWRKILLPKTKSLMGQSFHMQFLGNPGTGKTVVARIVGKLLVEMGVIKGKKMHVKKGQKIVTQNAEVFVEVSRGDLVAEYVGQTAPKVIEAVGRARGGILFVDEAYSLKKEGKDSFGQEAVDTLIKEIEDKRDRMIVIFAGYEREMETFFDSNPGFASRVPFKFFFDDYTCDQLRAIADLFLGKKSFTASDDADLWLDRTIGFTTGCCQDSDCESTRDNGNGRTVRNILESTYRNFAARVVPSMHSDEDTRLVLDRAEEMQVTKKSMESKYRIEKGESWQKYLDRDYGKGALCSERAGPPGGRYTWSQLCSKAEGQLRELQGEDVMLVAVSKAMDALLPSCRDARKDLGKMEALAQRALQVITAEQWDELIDPLMDEDCAGVLSVLESIQDPPPAPHYDTISIMKEAPKLKPVMDKLDKLVGLANVKETMGKLYGLVKISTWRGMLDLGSLDGQSFHMRFLGNPGTGKTVVARIVGELLVQMEVVSMPEEHRQALEKAERAKAKEDGRTLPRGGKVELPMIFKEVSRADLVASYSGQTAPKVEKAVTSALGGVLFIDEAYAIVRDGKDSFGQEAVDTLIKEMEDKRDSVVVILAGYETEMDTFFDSNPGFKSRVPLNFRFEDYSCSELTRISSLVLQSRGVKLTQGSQAATYLDNLIAFSTGCCEDVSDPDCHPSRENGNGRTVRNIVEALSRTMATRVMQEHRDDAPDYSSITEDELTVLQARDVESVAEFQAAARLKRPCGKEGVLEELRKSLGSPGALEGWFKQHKRSNPISQLHTIVRETSRAAESLAVFQDSDQLSEVQELCSAELNEVKSAIRAKASATCGSASTPGLLRTLGNSINPEASLTVEEYEEMMDSIQTTSAEAEVLQRLLSGDVPAQLQDLSVSAENCAAGVEALQKHSLLMPLKEAVSLLSGDMKL